MTILNIKLDFPHLKIEQIPNKSYFVVNDQHRIRYEDLNKTEVISNLLYMVLKKTDEYYRDYDEPDDEMEGIHRWSFDGKGAEPCLLIRKHK